MPFSNYTTLNVENLIKEFGLDLKQGLSAEQIEASRQKNGENSLDEKEHTILSIFFRQFKSSFIYLLIFAAGLSFALGEKLDATFIILFVSINVLFGFYQEYRSEQSLKLLRKYVISYSKVLRSGLFVKIPNKEIVAGDIIQVETGDIIPADVRFLNINNLNIDESILTGESVAVSKKSDASSVAETQVYEAQNIGFSGTNVISGVGEGVVFAVGKKTQMGNIAHLAETASHESVFEKETSKISKFILKLVLLTLGLVFVANLGVKGSASNVTELLLFSIALAVSVIPEALPVVTTFSLSKGAVDLAKKKVIVKRLSAIEDLGSVQVLCTDKTGTITENKLEIAEIYSKDKSKTIFYSAVSADTSSFFTPIFAKLTKDQKNIIQMLHKVKEFPFDPERRRGSVLIKMDNAFEIIIRGAAEEMIGYVHDLKPDEKQKALEWVTKQGLEGKRVIGIAASSIKNITDYKEESETKFAALVGMISFIDPIKKTAEGAIKDARHLGLQIKILTGDSKEIAGAVGYKIGLIESPDKVMSGKDLDNLSPEEFVKACADFHVFARLAPEQKYRIIESLKKTSEVGFLGEGINDAPALKAANIGICVAEASDIARASSDVILLHKNLEVIVNGIQEGRKVFANTTKYIRTTLASNFGNFYAIATATLFIKFLPMLPIQLLLVNLLTDFPMISIAGDSIDPDELREPSNLDFREFTILCSILGLVSTLIDFSFFFLFVRKGEPTLQTAWFIGSVLTELVFVYSIRTKKVFFKSKFPNITLILLTVVAGIFAIVLPFISLGHDVFRFESLSITNLSIVFGLVVVYFVLTEVAKNAYYHFAKKRTSS
ncbi:MAG TPA: HAD-IC family P-type ATPase [Candidatus Saccharimonadales bacterium]|nr:HAD-IC family P-type ATPase [Candidatus Saccharimonadales bacterium]